MRILKEDILVLVIDFQEKLVPVMKHQEELIKKTEVLLQGLCALNVPMLITRQYPKGLGDTVLSIKDVLSDQTLTLDKITFSCLDDVMIWDSIKKSGCKTVLLCGIETHICVLQTAIGLIENGYSVLLVEDCTASRRTEDHKIGLQRAYLEGAIPTTCESILFELTKQAGTEAFKQISTLVKSL